MAQQQPPSPRDGTLPENIPVAQEYQPPPQWSADAGAPPPAAAPYYYPPAMGAPVGGEKPGVAAGMPYGGGYAPPVAAPVQGDAPVCCGLRKKSAILLALIAALVVVLGAAGIGVGVGLSGGDDSSDTKSGSGGAQPVDGVNLPQAPRTAPPSSDNIALPPTAVITPGGPSTLITPTPTPGITTSTPRPGTSPTPRPPPPSAADGPSSGLNRADMLILAMNAKRNPGDTLIASGNPGLGCVADEISDKLADQYEPTATNPCQFGSNTYVANTFRDALTKCGINDPKAQSHDALFSCKVPGATAQDVVDTWAADSDISVTLRNSTYKYVGSSVTNIVRTSTQVTLARYWVAALGVKEQ